MLNVSVDCSPCSQGLMLPGVLNVTDIKVALRNLCISPALLVVEANSWDSNKVRRINECLHMWLY